MKKSNRRKNIESTAALYLRITREDELAGDSNSITMQKKLLTKIATEKGYTNLIYFIDDGITGTTDKRPDFQKMLSEIEAGNISAVFVKDMSRLTRDQAMHIELTRKFFPLHDIRLVAVADGVDTAEREDELSPFRGLMNEMYAQDISKKRRATNRIKGNSGEPLSPPPYGYIKSPENPKFWIIDEEAAAVVRRIYSMRLAQFGTEQIASALTADKILNPTHYFASKGIRRNGMKSAREPHHWNHSTIVKILRVQEYCGDIINFKTYSKSFFLKQRIPNAPENMEVFRDVHEAVIQRSDFEKVQQMKQNRTRARKTGDGERNIFSGLLICSECGRNLHYHVNSKNPDIRFFSCNNSKSNRGTCETTHYIRVDFLEQVVSAELRRLTRFAKQYEDAFATLVMGHSLQVSQDERSRKEREKYTKNARIRELDKLIERLYEDNVSGKVSDERFYRMTASYEAEQGGLMQDVKTLTAELSKEGREAMSTEEFLKTVRKYTRARKLNPAMLHELIQHIEVHSAEKVDGKKVQRLVIHYHCVGNITIPELKNLENPEIELKIRKGVALSYSA